jgi:hypothetical protein
MPHGLEHRLSVPEERKAAGGRTKANERATKKRQVKTLKGNSDNKKMQFVRVRKGGRERESEREQPLFLCKERWAYEDITLVSGGLDRRKEEAEPREERNGIKIVRNRKKVLGGRGRGEGAVGSDQKLVKRKSG